MKIAVANWSRRQSGGVEEYISRLATLLADSGRHEMLLFHELDDPATLARIRLPEDVPCVHERALGREAALAQLKRYAPDIVYVQTLHDPELAITLGGWPGAVFSAHAYNATCVSGQKLHMRPEPRPCGRVLGPGCLLHYYPHRCGGLDPRIMLERYGTAQKHLRAIRLAGALVVHSVHMQQEFERHGITAHLVPLPLAPAGPPRPFVTPDEPLVLLYLGRLTRIKGGYDLLEAARRVQERLGKRVECVFAGDGPDRAKMEAAARRVQRPGLTIRFLGWVEAEAREEALARAHLLVVPSLWPEPFGMVGLEAAAVGLPVVGFATGGITDWLQEGVNGALAPGDAPNAADLAAAIVRCVGDAATYRRLRQGAQQTYQAHADRNTLAALERAFAAAIDQRARRS